MRSHKLGKLLLVLLLSVVSSAALALNTVVVTEGYFHPQPFGVRICAQTIPAIPNAQMTFYGESIFGTKPVPATTIANSLGFGCARTNWPVGVYSVQVNADSLWSPFVAVTVADLNRICCGVAAGGAVGIFHYGVPGNIIRTLEPRFATFGLLYNQGCSPGNCYRIPFQLLYFDHDHPLGPVSFVAKSFMQMQFGASPNPGSIVRFVGNGLFQQGAGSPMYVRYCVETVDGNPDRFKLELSNFAGQVIYKSSIGIGYEGAVIGGNVFVDCPG